MPGVGCLAILVYIIMNLYIPTRQIINRAGELVTQWGEYILAETLQQAEQLCPPGYTIDGILISESEEWGYFEGD